MKGRQTITVSSWLLWSYLLFFASIIFSFRFISSVSVGSLLITGIIYHKQQEGHFFNRRIINLFLIACSLYFFLTCFSWINNKSDYNVKEVALQSGLMLVPAIVSWSGFINDANRKKLLTWYCVFLLTAGLYCLGWSFANYLKTNDGRFFFYHQLMSPLKQHAIYFSVLVFFSLLQLWETARKKDWVFKPVWHYSFIAFFTIFLVLLSSKLVIVYYGVYLLYYFLSTELSASKKYGVIGGLAVIIAVLFFTNNPVSRRFREITKGDLTVVAKESFSPGDYFNGLQFRLLQWKLVPEILNKHHRWWLGLGAEEARSSLELEYTSRNMYQGLPGSNDKGYLIYNCHNQLLQSLLINGIAGALIFLLICYSILRVAWKKKNRVLTFTVMLLLLFSLTESVLETQYGIILFSFFPLYFYEQMQNKATEKG